MEEGEGLERLSKKWSFVLRVSGVKSDPIYMVGAVAQLHGFPISTPNLDFFPFQREKFGLKDVGSLAIIAS